MHLVRVHHVVFGVHVYELIIFVIYMSCFLCLVSILIDIVTLFSFKVVIGCLNQDICKVSLERVKLNLAKGHFFLREIVTLIIKEYNDPIYDDYRKYFH